MPFTFSRLEIPALVLIEAESFDDDRGSFREVYKRTAFRDAGIDLAALQLNECSSRAKVLRGLHYQLRPRAQGKLLRVLRGEIWDVAVDIRTGSPWFGRHVTARLSDESCRMIWVPPGFAHGYCVLSRRAVVSYLVTAEYSPEHERGIHFADEELAIDWPLERSELIVSERDAELPTLDGAETNFVYEPDTEST